MSSGEPWHFHPRIETDREDQLKSSYISFECIAGQEVQPRDGRREFFEPMDAYLGALAARTGPRDDFNGQRDHGQGLPSTPGGPSQSYNP